MLRIAPAMRLVRTLAREPIVQFVLAGSVLLAVYRAVSPDPPVADVVVTRADIDAQIARARAVGRPTGDEKEIARELADQELLYREAIALGLDKQDPIVRARLIQLMDFLSDTVHQEPSESEIESYHRLHSNEYRGLGRATFDQVYFSKQHRGERAARDARAAMAALRAGRESDPSGDAFVAGHHFVARSASDIDATFGPGFGQKVLALPLDEWSEPLMSPFGWHLVRVRERTDPGPKPLAEVREEVRATLLEEARAKARRDMLRSLRQRYRVVIQLDGEKP